MFFVSDVGSCILWVMEKSFWTLLIYVHSIWSYGTQVKIQSVSAGSLCRVGMMLKAPPPAKNIIDDVCQSIKPKYLTKWTCKADLELLKSWSEPPLLFSHFLKQVLILQHSLLFSSKSCCLTISVKQPTSNPSIKFIHCSSTFIIKTNWWEISFHVLHHLTYSFFFFLWCSLMLVPFGWVRVHYDQNNFGINRL